MMKTWIAALFLLLVGAAYASDSPANAGRVLVSGDTAELLGAGSPQKLSLTFADEFDRFAPFDGETGFWRTTYWFNSDGQKRGSEAYGYRTMPFDKQQQLYVDPGYTGAGKKPLGLNPFNVHDGILDITADRAPPEALPALSGYKYISGIITTKDVFQQAYGYFEMRAKLPAGKGFWPAFWLAPADQSWPPEIDIFEVLGQNPSLLYTTVHFFKEDGKTDKVGLELKVEDTSADFHIYGMSWTPTTVRFFIDRREVSATPTPKTLNKPMYVLANLGVGGRWPGPVDETTKFPATMSIDYIRVYQFDDLPRPKGVVRPSEGASPAS
jgi:beta-glucanase (GH16 family)